LVTDEGFLALKERIGEHTQIRINFLNHETLDRSYVMIFPDGSLIIPSGPNFLSYGPFLGIDDLEAVITSSQFDVVKHFRHSLGWSKKI
jgi:hypothetical protein